MGIRRDSQRLQPKCRSDQQAKISEWFAGGHRGRGLAREATAQ